VWDEDQRAVAAATILSSAADDVESSTWNWWRKRVGELRSLAEEHSNASNELTRSEPHVPDASERVPADWLESLGMLFDMEWTRSALRYLRARPRLLALLLLLLFALSFLAKEFIGSRLQGVFEESALSADSVASAP
jgi:hypothetical protein